MEKTGENNKNSSFGFGTGVVCTVVGAALGAFAYHQWNKEKMEQYSYGSPEKVYNKETCPICLDDMNKLVVLSCGHQYHACCIKELKGDARKCPICRKSF
ncbi:hypothetical protein C0J52_21565 [Blattella germanica]|nr:hypothetical protein C0J52_21565 [Blattella germanica]